MALGSMLLSSTAACFLLASGIQLFVSTWRDFRSSLNVQWRRQSEQSRLRRAAQRLRMSGELHCQSDHGYHNNGPAWRMVEVIEIQDESVDCRSFFLADPNGEELPYFQPGQFVSVRPALGGSGRPTRCYSLSDAPNPNWWRITVKRLSSPDGLSDWLHNRVRVGDSLLLGGPYGEFVLDTSSNAPIIFLAAGIGITPLLSMLKHALTLAPARDIKLFFQIQDEDHWPFGQMIHAWQAACPKLQVVSYFSRIEPTGNKCLPSVEHDCVKAGKFEVDDVFRSGIDRAHGDYYLCGPVAWMQRLTDDLIAGGIPAAQIRSESFGGVAPVNESDTGDVQTWSLQFALSGLTIPSNTQSMSIWEAAHENGLELPSACHSGACGSCRMKLNSGRIKYRTEPTCTVSQDEVLTCIAQPLGDVILEA